MTFRATNTFAHLIDMTRPQGKSRYFVPTFYLFSPQNDQLSSGSNDCTIKVWSAATGWWVRRLVGMTSVRALAAKGGGAGVRVELNSDAVS